MAAKKHNWVTSGYKGPQLKGQAEGQRGEVEEEFNRQVLMAVAGCTMYSPERERQLDEALGMTAHAPEYAMPNEDFFKDTEQTLDDLAGPTPEDLAQMEAELEDMETSKTS